MAKVYLMSVTVPGDTLARLVAQADDGAIETVRAGRGGPFGAALYVCGPNGRDMVAIGGVKGNAVLETGMASAHAEDQALCAASVAELRVILKGRNPEETAVILASSAESCPACQAKAEILARILIQEKRLLPRHFVVAYGASYAETKAVAGFNDALYHEDMLRPPGQRLISVGSRDFGSLPPEIGLLLLEHPADPAAVIAAGEECFFAGHDRRSEHFVFTREVCAIREACEWRGNRGRAEPWNLGGATLYTFTTEPGPLAYAECQWANVTRWISLTVTGSARWVTQEAPGIGNARLFEAVAARPYNGPESVLRVVQVTPFANKAQQEWRARAAENPEIFKIYNGIAG